MLENALFVTNDNPKDDVCPVFRRRFTVKGEVRAAALTVTARGLYEAYLNGGRVGDFLFAPGFTSYSHRIQVQTYDVTAQLTGDENELLLYNAGGWHYGAIQRGAYENLGERAVIASLTLTYADGTSETLVTDEGWEWAKTGYLFSDIYHGETFDANIAADGWQPVSIAARGMAALIPQEGEEVREAESCPAVGLIVTPKGEKVIDFGQEVTGYVEFRTVGEKGSRIVLDHAEVLDAEGNFYTENYRKARSRVTYITDGNRENWYHPHFSFQGFRYIRLTEYPTDEIYVGDFIARAVHSDMKRTGTFVCSDPLVNRLYENVIWGQRGNFLDIPTDCPQRDERLGWTGDAQVFCRTAAYNYDVKRFFEKWLRDLALDQSENGAVPAVVPSLWAPNGAFAWGDAATVCPWEIYLAYGDKAVLETQFASMKAWVDYLKNKGDGPKEWSSGPQYGDWLGLDAEEGSYHGATDNKLLAAAFLVYASGLLVKAGKALGRDMSEYEALNAHVRSVFRETFVGEDGMLTCDTQTAYVCALHFGLAPDKEKYAAHLAEKIHKNGDRLRTGFIGTAYIMDALTDNGYADVAYTLLLQKEFPSWLYCVRKGATTIWEHWDGLKPDGSMWSADMNSFNHYAYGAVASWLYGAAAGIRPDETKPGYELIRIHPIPDPRLDFVEASLETRFGTIRSRWEKAAGKPGVYRAEITVPEGAEAELTLGKTRRHVCAGTYSELFEA